mgnify:CR=1 FL=1
MTKGDDPFSVGAQHDVPREITRFPKGHVKPCPYGTYVEVDAPSGDVGHVKPCPYGTCETSLVAFPVNGCHAVPPSSPLCHPQLFFVILAKAGIHGPRHAFWIPTFVGMTGWGAGMTGSKESAAFNGYSGAMNVAPTPCCSNLFCQRACAKSLLHPLNRHFRSFLRFSRGHTTVQIAGRVRGEGRSYALIHVVGAFLSTLSRPLRAQRISRMAGLEHSPELLGKNWTVE